jgi:hypothetical protein
MLLRLVCSLTRCGERVLAADELLQQHGEVRRDVLEGGLSLDQVALLSAALNQRVNWDPPKRGDALRGPQRPRPSH